MKTLLDDLRAIRRNMQYPENWHECGICYSLSYVEGLKRGRDRLEVEEKSRQFKDLAMRWPRSGGDPAFPVPAGSPVEGDSRLYAFTFLNGDREKQEDSTPEYMWDRANSAYAANRWELLEWAIAELEKEMGE